MQSDGAARGLESTELRQFDATGAEQSFTVPSGVSDLFLSLWGGAGGGSNAEGYSHAGGPGAFASGRVAVGAGDVVTVVVGKGGATCDNCDMARAFPGGGGDQAASSRA